MTEYTFFSILGKTFGIAVKPFRWLYVHGNSGLQVGGLRVGKLEVIW